MNQGKTLTTLGFLDIFYFPWTDFIFPGRELLAVYNFSFCKMQLTPPSRSWQGCAVYRRRCRGGGLRSMRAAAKVRLKQAV